MGWIVAAIAVFFLLKNGGLSNILPSPAATVAGINNAGATLIPTMAMASVPGVPGSTSGGCSGCSKGATSVGGPLPVMPILRSIPSGRTLIAPSSPLAPQSAPSSFVHSALGGAEELIN